MGFLQSGSKLLFRRKRREKESCLSQSHEDISNMGNNFAPPPPGIIRKKSGSFSRRLIKRFSFRSSGKSKGKATATNGGANSVENWWQSRGSLELKKGSLSGKINSSVVVDELNTRCGTYLQEDAAERDL